MASHTSALMAGQLANQTLLDTATSVASFEAKFAATRAEVEKLSVKLDPSDGTVIPDSQGDQELTAAANSLVASCKDSRTRLCDLDAQCQGYADQARSSHASLARELAACTPPPSGPDDAFLPDECDMIVRTALRIMAMPGLQLGDSLQAEIAECVAAYSHGHPAPDAAAHSRAPSPQLPRAGRVESQEVRTLQRALARAQTDAKELDADAAAAAKRLAAEEGRNRIFRLELDEARQRAEGAEASATKLRGEVAALEAAAAEACKDPPPAAELEAVRALVSGLEAELQGVREVWAEHLLTAGKLGAANLDISNLRARVAALQSENGNLAARLGAQDQTCRALDELAIQRGATVDALNDKVRTLKDTVDNMRAEAARHEEDLKHRDRQQGVASLKISGLEISLRMQTQRAENAEAQLADARRKLSAQTRDLAAAVGSARAELARAREDLTHQADELRGERDAATLRAAAVEAEYGSLRRRHESRVKMGLELQAEARGAGEQAARRIAELDAELDAERSRRDEAVSSGTSAAAERDAVQARLDVAVAECARLRAERDAARTSGDFATQRLCNAVCQLPLPPTAFSELFAMLQRCPAVESLAGPTSTIPWHVDLPWPAVADDFVLPNMDHPLLVTVSLFAVGITRRTSAPIVLHLLRQLLDYLRVAVSEQVEVVLAVVHVVVEDVQRNPPHVATGSLGDGDLGRPDLASGTG